MSGNHPLTPGLRACLSAVARPSHKAFLTSVCYPKRNGSCRERAGAVPTGSSDWLGVVFLVLLIAGFIYVIQPLLRPAPRPPECAFTVTVSMEAQGFSGVTTYCHDTRLENADLWPKVLVLRKEGTKVLVEAGYNVSGTIVCCGKGSPALTSRAVAHELRGVEEIIGYRYENDTLTLKLRVRYPEWRPRTPEERALIPEKCLEAMNRIEDDLKRELLMRSLYVLGGLIVVMIVLLYIANRYAYEGFSGILPLR